MPIYEYQCGQCGNIEEAIQKFSDAPLETCNKCSGKLNKLISQNSFHLKGSGWYVTDYANKSNNHKTKPKADTANDNKKSANSCSTATSCESSCTNKSKENN